MDKRKGFWKVLLILMIVSAIVQTALVAYLVLGKRLAQGHRQADIAKDYPVSKYTIYKISKGINWANI